MLSFKKKIPTLCFNRKDNKNYRENGIWDAIRGYGEADLRYSMSDP